MRVGTKEMMPIWLNSSIVMGLEKETFRCTDPNMDIFTSAVEGDGCWSVETEYGITADDFLVWNPAVGTDCSRLWLSYAYCVGV
ncbi:LysM peptidoglycan-binding domain-containing protein [Aspergillus undulatus]|uniref:LysM peptidoglycan-binding domain-containing protein n=1 Tax=Aspergillus undulatus TaxID=1810928 RepID=UPI003CCE1198